MLSPSSMVPSFGLGNRMYCSSAMENCEAFQICSTNTLTPFISVPSRARKTRSSLRERLAERKRGGKIGKTGWTGAISVVAVL